MSECIKCSESVMLKEALRQKYIVEIVDTARQLDEKNAKKLIRFLEYLNSDEYDPNLKGEALFAAFEAREAVMSNEN